MVFSVKLKSLINRYLKLLKLNLWKNNLIIIFNNSIGNNNEKIEQSTSVKNVEKEFNCKLREISMGMSQDYKIAAQKGATMLRIGRKLFE